MSIATKEALVIYIYIYIYIIYIYIYNVVVVNLLPLKSGANRFEFLQECLFQLKIYQPKMNELAFDHCLFHEAAIASEGLSCTKSQLLLLTLVFFLNISGFAVVSSGYTAIQYVGHFTVFAPNGTLI
jgi:hypothetical protein